MHLECPVHPLDRRQSELLLIWSQFDSQPTIDITLTSPNIPYFPYIPYTPYFPGRF